MGKNEVNLKAIEYNPLTQFQILNQSSLEPSTFLLYSKLSHNNCSGGFLDFKFGGNQGNNCKVCKKDTKRCTGHFGFIKLNLPVLNLGYMKTISFILDIICKNCSKLLIPNKIEEENFRNLIGNLKSIGNFSAGFCETLLLNRCKGVKYCPRCGCVNGKLKKSNLMTFDYFLKIENTKKDKSIEIERKLDFDYQEDRISFTPLEIFEILKKVSDHDLELMNIDNTLVRAEDFICSVLPVPPINVRPSVKLGNHSTNEDELTIKLGEIQKLNLKIGEFLKTNDSFEDLIIHWNLLQIECFRYLNSEIGSNGINNFTEKGLFQRLKGKTGRFRGTLSGKRVDFSGRTVISPDPYLPLNFIGLPIKMASRLTIPEKINFFNTERLFRSILRGKDRYPGASCLIDRTGKKQIFLGNNFLYNSASFQDFTVERNLFENDFLLLNRQPSLHKVSIMCHRVKIINGKTITINQSVCKPYNADFDGDEMNIHIPQTIKARTEASVLMHLVLNLNSPRSGEIQIAGIQDFLSSFHVLTSRNNFFLNKEFQMSIAHLNYWAEGKNFPIPSIIKPINMWTGKQVFGFILSCTLTTNFLSHKINPRKNYDPHYFFNTREKFFSYSDQNCAPFMCRKEGFIMLKNHELICGRLGKKIMGPSSVQSFLTALIGNYPNSIVCLLISNLGKFSSNWFENIGFSVGLSDFKENKKIPKVKNNFLLQMRNLKHFYDYNFSNKDRIIMNRENKVVNLYSKFRTIIGENVIRFEITRQTNLQDMVASGAKGNNVNLCQMMSCLGYQQTRKDKQYLRIPQRILPYFKIDHTYQNNFIDGVILNSFTKGLSFPDLFFHASAGREGLIDTAVKTSETGYLQRKLFKTLENLVNLQDGTVRSSRGRLVQVKFGEDSIDPEKTCKLANLCTHSIMIGDNSTCPSQFFFNKQEIETFFRGHFLIQTNSLFINKEKGSILPNLPKNIEKSKQLSAIQSEIFLSRLLKGLNFSRSDPHTSVGGLAAQSIGEPGTQMTLQTFHQAGIGSKGIALGVPRLNEIVNCSYHIHSPKTKMRIFKLSRKIDSAHYLKKLNLVFLGEICKEIYFILGLRSSFLKFKIKKKIRELYGKSFLLLKFKENISRKIKLDNHFSSSHSKDFFYIYMRFNQVLGLENYKFSKLIPVIRISKERLVSIPIFGEAIIGSINIREKINSYIFITKKSDIQTLMALPYIDSASVVTNHIITIQETLGIEATRNLIIQEIQGVFESYKIPIDIRHSSLISDLMTFYGKVNPINRFGLGNSNENTLIVASFERTLDVLFESSSRKNIDYNFGVSESIILGKKSPVGTGLSTVF